jgi:hypothetical protein
MMSKNEPPRPKTPTEIYLEELRKSGVTEAHLAELLKSPQRLRSVVMHTIDKSVAARHAPDPEGKKGISEISPRQVYDATIAIFRSKEQGVSMRRVQDRLNANSTLMVAFQARKGERSSYRGAYLLGDRGLPWPDTLDALKQCIKAVMFSYIDHIVPGSVCEELLAYLDTLEPGSESIKRLREQVAGDGWTSAHRARSFDIANSIFYDRGLRHR